MGSLKTNYPELNWQILDNWIWNARQLDLEFPPPPKKKGTENVLVTLSSFFDVFVFSYCCCTPFKDKHSCKAKGYLSFEEHFHKHFVMIRTIPLIKLLFIYTIKMYCFAVYVIKTFRNDPSICPQTSTPPFLKHSNVSHISILPLSMEVCFLRLT